ncbi:hypothetical protein ACFVT1_31375 [Streptomyces sp. NPDC057963]|uniref:hypothetical protein n=1 Tax=Streptomyces sp. NPDC057963 TaxID=3346290 RepID=UPI0036E5F363
MIAPEYTHGVAVCATGKGRPPYGVVRPCPGLAAASPRLAVLHALVRSAQEARELTALLPEG